MAQFSNVKLHLVLTIIQVGYAGFQLLSKLAIADGLNKTTYPVFRNLIGFLVLFPFAVQFERKERPKLTFSHVIHFFLLGLSAVAFGQGLYIYGLDLSSPTFASAFQNSIPALTFVMAAISGVEDVTLKRRDGQAKLCGAIFAGLGATIMTVYKGPLIIKSVHFSYVVPAQHTIIQASLHSRSGMSWYLGPVCLIVSCVAFAAFYIIQAKTLKIYPAHLSVVCLTNLWGAVQLAVFAIISTPTVSIWKLQSRIQLIAVLYSGLVASGLMFSLQAWCMQRAGPVIVSAYQPLQTVVVGLISMAFLGEAFYLGSLFGSILIIAGLYLVTWGRQNKLQPQDMEEKVEAGSLTQPLVN